MQSNDCHIPHPLQRDGTSQSQRLVAALKPEYVAVDQRELADLLMYARQYARLLRFYTPENHPGGDWRAFIEHDVSTLVALIAHTDHEDVRDENDALHEEVRATPKAAAKGEAFAALFPPLVALAGKIDAWYEDAVDGLKLHTALVRLIHSTLIDALRTLIAIAERARAVGLPVEAIDTAGFNEVWVLDHIQADASLFESGTAMDTDEIDAAAQRVKTVFERFYEALVFLVANAQTYLQETLDDYPEHQPHMALFLTFLRLFRIAQDHLNTLTKGHLLFYYQEVLRLAHAPETPDSVHLIFELAKTFHGHQVPEGTALKAGKDASGANLFYETDDELVVNRASLDEEHGLKSLFIEQNSRVRNLYAAPKANSADGEGGEIEEEDGKWEPFGGTMMPEATVGFAVASPMFLLAEGTRTVTLTLDVNIVPAFMPKQVAAIEKELTHNVAVYASGEKAWVPVEVTDVEIKGGAPAGGVKERLSELIRLLPDPTPGPRILAGSGIQPRTTPAGRLQLDAIATAEVVYHLRLGPEAAAIVPYDDEVLSDGFVTEHAVFKFVLDNDGYSALDGFDLHLAKDLEAYEEGVVYDKGDYVTVGREVYRAEAKPDGEPSSEGSGWVLVGTIEDFDAGGTYVRGDYVRYQEQIFQARRNGAQTTLPGTNAAVWRPVPRSYPYKYFEALELRQLQIDATVKGVQSLLLENDQGVLNPAKPFFPFGPQPKKGGSFYVGSPEVFSKTLSQLTLHVAWGDLPDENFSTYYQEYGEKTNNAFDSPIDGNGDFKGAFHLLYGGQWLNTDAQAPIDQPEQALFDDVMVTMLPMAGTTGTPSPGGGPGGVGGLPGGPGGLGGLPGGPGGSGGLPGGLGGGLSGGPGGIGSLPGGVGGAGAGGLTGKPQPVKVPGRPAEDRTFTLNLSPALRRPDALDAFDRFSQRLQYGFLRLDLLDSFLHTLYPQVLAKRAIAGDPDLPNPPYTPLITSLRLDYTASETIDYTALTRHDYDDRVERLFHIHPFGWVEVFPIADDDAAEDLYIDRTPVPRFLVNVETTTGTTVPKRAEGTLFIGLKDLVPPQNLSMLFQVAEGSADPEADTQEVVWSYLAKNRWTDFLSTEILRDTTNGLLTSGIISFAMPKTMTAKNTILPGGLHWIKASVPEQTEAVSKPIAVIPQAVRATFENQQNDPSHLATALPAETIGKLKERRAAIKAVSQPYASFGGRVAEQDDAFYTRVSERLRHKQRAVTIFDYERLVLQAFPEVYKVKCITHTGDDCEHEPGSVKVIVVPNLRNKNAVDPLQPKVNKNTLEEIDELLAAHASNFITLYVENPRYEQVQVDFTVKFVAGKDVGFHLRRLEEDIIRFLSPWLYEEGADLAFGGRIHRSWILNFVEERDYVDFVTDFMMHHTAEGEKDLNVEEAAAKTASSVLVSAVTHLIKESTLVACA